MAEKSVDSTFSEYENEHTALRAALKAADDFLDGLRVEAAAILNRVEQAHARLGLVTERVGNLERGRP